MIKAEKLRKIADVQSERLKATQESLEKKRIIDLQKKIEEKLFPYLEDELLRWGSAGNYEFHFYLNDHPLYLESVNFPFTYDFIKDHVEQYGYIVSGVGNNYESLEAKFLVKISWENK